MACEIEIGGPFVTFSFDDTRVDDVLEVLKHGRKTGVSVTQAFREHEKCPVEMKEWLDKGYEHKFDWVTALGGITLVFFDEPNRG